MPTTADEVLLRELSLRVWCSDACQLAELLATAENEVERLREAKRQWEAREKLWRERVLLESRCAGYDLQGTEHERLAKLRAELGVDDGE